MKIQHLNKLNTKIIILALLLILTIIPYSKAWNNGDGGTGEFTYASDFVDYNFDYHYGTHDWIADLALEILSNNNTSAWQWLRDYETIYYLGTEAPDNSGIDIILNGTALTGFGDKTYHHIYFNADGTILEDNSAVRAKWCGDHADVALTDGNFQVAAYYLGAMTHYIADMSMFSHVMDNTETINYDAHHSTIEGYVQTRTNEVDDKMGFFLIDTSEDVISKKPFNAAIDTANLTAGEADYLHNNHFTGWKQTYSARSIDTVAHQNYYSKMEDLLQNGIEEIASAIQYVSEDYNIEGDENKILPAFPISFIIGLSVCSLIVIAKKMRNFALRD
jgi:hypothetical protein